MPRPPASVKATFEILREHYYAKPPNMKPFEVLIFTILSQRTRDENTEVATERVLSKYPTPIALANAELDIVEELARPAGFYRAKAKSIIAVSKILIEEYGGEVPDDMDKLLALPSVGRKTANCVLVYGFGIKALPVDIHVHRISNRLGWSNTQHPDDTEFVLNDLIPKEYWIEINSLLIDFGRKTCQPRRPKCERCQIEKLCPSSTIQEDQE